MADSPQSFLEGFLKRYPSTKYLRLVVTPYCGIQVVKAIPIHHALQSAAKSNVLVPGTEPAPVNGQALPHTDAHGVVHGSLNFPSALNACITELGGIDFSGVEPGDDCLQIDWTTLRPILSDPECAFLTCSLYNNAPGDTWYGYDHDARVLLRNVEKRAKAELDLEFLVGHEVEYVLFDAGDPKTPLVDTVNSYCGNMFGQRGMNILKEIVDSLEHAGIHVWSFHPEHSSSGQYEFQLCPGTPLSSCDQLEFAIHTIRSVATKNKCIATISATPWGGGVTGRHFHISHSHPEVSDFFRDGVLHHMESLSAPLMGNIEGWKKRAMVTGGKSCWWGKNKFAPINNKAPGRHEIRVADCHFASYLQVASILLAGMDGVERKLQVSQKEEMSIEDTLKYIRAGEDSTVRAELQKKYSLDIVLPADLGEAIEKWEKDMGFWTKGFNSHATKAFLMVLKKRWTDRTKHSPDEMRMKLIATM